MIHEFNNVLRVFFSCSLLQKLTTSSFTSHELCWWRKLPSSCKSVRCVQECMLGWWARIFRHSMKSVQWTAAPLQICHGFHIHCLAQIYATQVPASNLHLPKYLKSRQFKSHWIYDAINLFWCLINTDNIMIATTWEKNVSDQCFSMCCQWCKELFHRHLAGVS